MTATTIDPRETTTATTDEPREKPRRREQHRRLSTRHLGAFVAAAATPAVAMVAPAPAHATTRSVTYWNGRCLEPGSNVWGYPRTPRFLDNEASALSNCAEHMSSGWLSVNIYRVYDWADLARQFGLGYVYTGAYVYKTLEVQGSCTHVGYRHSHHVHCWSYRSF